MENRTEFLKGVDIFSSLESQEINSVTEIMSSVTLKGGEILFREGDPGDELFIVETGLIASTIRLPDGNERTVAEFTSGDFFGEMAIFENAPRSATCTAINKTALCRLHQNDFFKFLKSRPSTAIKIMHRMLSITTQRLNNTSGFLSEMIQWGNDARKRAITDELTGVYNRRYLDESLEEHFASARSSGSSFCLAMVDLDYFRVINESYGHETGDGLLLGVVDLFREKLREQDIIARYGGDEFSVIFPDTNLDKAWELAESVRSAIEKLEILTEFEGPVKKVSTSMGIACYPSSADDIKNLKARADEALYQAKEGGRNRVIKAES